MRRHQELRRFARKDFKRIMTDLIYIGVVVLFFVVSGLYIRLCEKM